MASTTNTRHTPQAAALTELILEVFRLNGRLLAVGDGLAEPVGLTSARWQVLGAMALAVAPQPVANIARNMGLTRQAVQRTVNELAAEGFVTLDANPHHRRAKLVVLTPKGQAAFDAVSRVQIPWANGLARGLATTEVMAVAKLLKTLTTRLEAD
jgi:DNA-binding MarR family transcriptional regulator